MNFSKLKIASVFFICLFGILFAAPNFLKSEQLSKLPPVLTRKLNLGLELQGGSYLQLQVNLNEAYKSTFEKLPLKKYLKKAKVSYTNYQVSEKGVSIALKHVDDFKRLADVAALIDKSLSVELDGTTALFMYNTDQRRERDAKIINHSIEVVRRRVDETGTKEPYIYQQGLDRIVLQLPGVDNPGEVKQLLGKTGRLAFRLVAGIVGKDHPLDKDVLTDNVTHTQYYVDRDTLLTGEELTTVKVTSDGGKNGVYFELNSFGTERFKEITAHNVGKQLAIIIDNEIVTAPMIHQAIPMGAAAISSDKTTLQEATQLKKILASGSLPAPLTVVEERVVGPSLGADSIEHGKAAVIWSFILVALFMLVKYYAFGLFASVSLLFNVILLVASLTLLGATLTLPGIAGIALTIGIAVDANVLIFERIKEELRLGMKPLRAIIVGFERAMTAIIDSNLTTLIGAAILYEFGSGPIRGFAVTLALGVMISMFTALTLTQLQIYLWARNRRLNSLPIGRIGKKQEVVS